MSAVASLALAGGLLWLALRGADLAEIGPALAGGAWGWAVPFVAVGVLSVVVRAWRWGLLIEALPGRPRAGLRLTTASVFIGYLVNYAAPRLGEVARTANVARGSDASFSGVLGTVVAERVLDVVALALALGAVAVAYGDRLSVVWDAAVAGAREALASVPGGAVWALAVAALAAAAVGVWWLRRRPAAGDGGGAGSLLDAFRDGLASLARTGRPVALVGSTAALWACYVVMSDLPLRILGLSDAYGLGLAEAGAVMAVGGVGMALPAPGGTGSFHYATVQALTVLFAVAATSAATYAILVHAAGVVFYCACGVLALVWQGTTLGDVRAQAEAAS